MNTITFDMSCLGWSENDELTYQYLKRTANFIKDIMEHCGYIYLNRVYDVLGVKWDTEIKNICYITDFGPLKFKINKGIDDVWFIELSQ